MAETISQYQTNPYATAGQSVPTNPLVNPLVSADINPTGTVQAPPAQSSSEAKYLATSIETDMNNRISGAQTQSQINAQLQADKQKALEQANKDKQAQEQATIAKNQQIKETQDKIKQTQDLLTAAQGAGYTGDTEIKYDTNGNPIPVNKTTQLTPTITPPSNLDTETTSGRIEFYNQDPKAFDTWAKENGISEVEIDNIHAQAAADKLQKTATEYNEKLNQLANGTYPLTPEQLAALDALKKQWELTIEAQKGANDTYANSVSTMAALSGRTKYNTANVTGEVQQAIDTGINRIAQFQAAQTSAISLMREGFRKSNFEQVTNAYNAMINNDKAIVDTMNSIYDKAYQAQKDAQTQKDKIADDIYNRTTKPIQEIAVEAAKNGMKDTSSIASAKTVDEALKLAGSYLQTGTGDVGEYLFYMRDKQNNGLTPLGFQEWKDAKDAKQLKLESSKAYASAYATASGKAAAEKQLGINDTSIDNPNPDAKEILGQTGLSKLEFDYLIMGTKALTRLTQGERLKVISDVGEWARKNGVDVATFISQYDAYNKTLENNIKRVNQVKVAEGELKGTLDNLSVAADDSSFGSIRFENVLKLFAGKEFNDPNVSKYAFHLTQLQNELAMYNAAAGGKINNDGSVRTDDGDKAEATRIIKEGFAAGSIDGFNEALKASVGKMDIVLNSSLNTSRQNVWNLFGVGNNFKPSYDNPEQYVSSSQSNEKKFEEATTFLKNNPDIVGENPTAEDVFQYLMSQ